MASLPVANSAAQMPRTLIMAMRPLLISLARISSVYIFRPKGSPKLPGSLASFSRHANSRMLQANEEDDTPKHPLAGHHGSEGATDAFETRDLEEVLPDGSDRGHHGNAPVLQLRSAQLAEARLVAHLAEAQRVEVPHGFQRTDLL
mmetsp:Transcript_136562/g.424284  ORF Transcript_136562/g.424284 Transcript_136562/m.424284 type:complete len:146 (-) Transcript_136562:34-471(-)